MDTGYEYDDWEPPSEISMKLIHARRERSDKISKLMGDYLLKGYKMLGVVCPQCDTILMQTKQGTNYCIACSELDSDADKDDPVTSQTAALALVRETSSNPAAQSTPTPTPPSQPVNLVNRPSIATQSGERQSEVSTTHRTPEPAVLSRVPQPSWLPQGTNVSTNAASSGSCGEGERYVKDLLDKLDWAAGELRGTMSVEYSIQLCQLIKSCAEAVTSVRAALNSRN